jgi:hypothetical protein
LANVICQISLKKVPSNNGGVWKRFPISFSFEETGVAPEKVGHRAILLPKQVPGRHNYQKTETEGKWIVAT